MGRASNPYPFVWIFRRKIRVNDGQGQILYVAVAEVLRPFRQTPPTGVIIRRLFSFNLLYALFMLFLNSLPLLSHEIDLCLLLWVES